MPLTDTAIRKAIPGARDRKLFDRDGLYLLLKPSGARWWRFKYRFDGRERGLSFGVYPEVPLKLARERRDAARRLIAQGIDPSDQRKAEAVAKAHSFELVAREWFALREAPADGTDQPALAAITLRKLLWILETALFPTLGRRPIAAITAADVLPALRTLEARGARETAHRARSIAGRIFRYAVATGRAPRDVTVDLRGALSPVVCEHRAAITEPARIGELLRAIDAYQGQPTTAYALKLAPLVFVRPGELRAAEWSEFDLPAAEWRIPAARMKMGERHIVPLSSQALELLNALQPLTGRGRYVFPSVRSAHRPMSDNTVNAALRRLGYTTDEMTGHGFRSLASTCLNELGWHPDLIELQLAHAERNKVRAAYNRAERLAERRRMMQAWADYLDGLRAGSNVVPITRAA